MNDIHDRPIECQPTKSENIKELLLSTEDMQYKTIDCLRAIRSFLTNVDDEQNKILSADCLKVSASCMKDSASLLMYRMSVILNGISEIMEVLGVEKIENGEINL